MPPLASCSQPQLAAGHESLGEKMNCSRWRLTLNLPGVCLRNAFLSGSNYPAVTQQTRETIRAAMRASLRRSRGEAPATLAAAAAATGRHSVISARIKIAAGAAAAVREDTCGPLAGAIAIHDGGASCLLQHRRTFGVKRVVQKRRHQLRIVHPKQDPYTPPSPSSPASGRSPLPLSLVNSGPVRRLLYSGSAAAAAAAAAVDWGQYCSPCRGVRWHPCGAWRVQFDRRCVEKNFFVRADLYFRVGLYGFHGARQRAVNYRRRLEVEWEELQQTWRDLAKKEAEQRSGRTEHTTTRQQQQQHHQQEQRGASLGRDSPL